MRVGRFSAGEIAWHRQNLNCAGLDPPETYIVRVRCPTPTAKNQSTVPLPPHDQHSQQQTAIVQQYPYRPRYKRRTMLCAAGELCHLPARTPEPPDGHECRGGCGGRLHGCCGEIESEAGHEYHRLCHTCSSKLKAKASSTATAKRKAQHAGDAPKRTKTAEAKQLAKSGPRTRLTLKRW